MGLAQLHDIVNSSFKEPESPLIKWLRLLRALYAIGEDGYEIRVNSDAIHVGIDKNGLAWYRTNALVCTRFTEPHF